MQFNKANMEASAKNGFTNATDAADYLVNHGVDVYKRQNHSRNLHALLCGIFCPNRQKGTVL